MRNSNLLLLFFCLFILLFFDLKAVAKSITTDFSKEYEVVSSDFHERYFNNTDVFFCEADMEAIQRLYAMNSKTNNSINRARVQYLEAFVLCYYRFPDYEKAIAMADQSLQVLTKEKYPLEFAKSVLIKGAANTYLSNYIAAYQYLNEALSVFELNNEPIYIAETYNYIGFLWRKLGEYENSLECCMKSGKISREMEYENAAHLMHSNAATIYQMLGNHREAIKIALEELAWSEQKRDTMSIIYLNNIIGDSYYSLNLLDSAYLYLNQGLILCQENSSSRSINHLCGILFSLGNIFYIENDHEQALALLEKALALNEHINNPAMKAHILSLLASIYDSCGEREKAYQYLQESVELRESLALQEKAYEIQNIKSRAELNHYEQQLQIAEQKAEIAHAHLLLMRLVMALALVVIGFILFYINRVKKVKSLENKQLAQQLKNEEMQRHLQKIQLEQQMAEKEREVATSQLLMAEKNKVLEQFVETFQMDYDANEIPENVWRKMKLFMSSHLRKDDEWNKSKILFDKVHPDFFKNLKKHTPYLSEHELKICAYVRIGMSTKQIAEIISVSQRSVISGRYRIKKKLQLSEEIALEDFLRNI